MHTNTYGSGNKIIVSVILFRHSLVNHVEVDNDSFKKEINFSFEQNHTS